MNTSRVSLKSKLSIGATKNVRFGGNVAEILEQYQKGNDSNYVLFLNQLRDPLLKSSQLVEWVQQCTELAQALDKDQNQIVNALLKVRWMEREAAVISAFQGFIITLVSSNPVHVRPVVKALTSCFIPVVSKKDEHKQKLNLEDEKIYETGHFILKTLLKLIPQASSIVTEVFQRSFPYMTKPVTVLEWYVKNLLYASTYLPHLRVEILELIVKCVADIDVHTPRVAIQDAEEEMEENDEDVTMFKMDEDVSNIDDDDEMKLPLAKTLDHLMTILLQYVKDFCFVHDEFQLHGAQKLLKELMKIFDDVILPLHGLVHVQFVIFYICSFKQSFCDTFIRHCWRKVTDPNIPSVLRQASVCYIASLIARAKFISLQSATACLDTMVTWCHDYVTKCADNTAFDFYSCDIARHSAFYSVCQAVFYILVFRHKEILDTKQGHSYMMGLNLHHLITSPLNPLKACLSSVVSMFTSTMRIHQILYCDTIVERNNRVILPVAGNTSSSLGNQNPLESFFPFDPYLLKRSSVYIDDLYTTWEGRVPQTEEVIEDEDEELIGSFSKSLSSPLAPGFSQLMSTTPF
uniref:RNA polymerase I-specific transcription initiation factor RRN3 n=1 Tax=Phallusia mammillata TaxID=59560 RepID=A0A6F9DRY6_9ASCI|nr:RNA polymerase I-specific transcription initiation factor RRN3 [Phallusia mammillata]